MELTQTDTFDPCAFVPSVLNDKAYEAIAVAIREGSYALKSIVKSVDIPKYLQNEFSSWAP